MPCCPGLSLPLLFQCTIYSRNEHAMSNGIDIITALILNDISPLCKYRMDLVLQLKVGPGAAHVSMSRCACWCV